ncbi:MAG TPA: hypothetical protein VGS60_10750 [Actinomycetes bacterium]|jgi:hypothetical protein|nr:hypothetical protein [Actinomycetes bacterium]
MDPGIPQLAGDECDELASFRRQPRADAPRSPEGALARVNLSTLTVASRAASAKVAVAQRYEGSQKVAAARVEAVTAKDPAGKAITVWYVTDMEVSASCAAPADSPAASPQPGITPGAPRPSDSQPPPGPVPTQTE